MVYRFTALSIVQYVQTSGYQVITHQSGLMDDQVWVIGSAIDQLDAGQALYKALYQY